VNVIVKARHMDMSDSVREYVESKSERMERVFDRIGDVEVVIDIEADKPVVEIIAHVRKRHTFVASHRDDDMYAAIDHCLDKIVQQLRRHKEKVRDHQGPGHDQTMTQP
jgi:putative sigma-54 modulation protein